MTAAVATASRRLPVARDGRATLQLVPTGPRSLAEVVDTAWAGLGAEMPVACLVCDGRMEPRFSAGAGMVGGRCRDCGSELD